MLLNLVLYCALQTSNNCEFSILTALSVEQTHSNQSNTDQIHWLYLLYTYNSANDIRDDLANALVFRENSKIIIEITHQIRHDTIINARFHNISLEEIITLTECNVNYHTSTCT